MKAKPLITLAFLALAAGAYKTVLQAVLDQAPLPTDIAASPEFPMSVPIEESAMRILHFDPKTWEVIASDPPLPTDGKYTSFPDCLSKFQRHGEINHVRRSEVQRNVSTLIFPEIMSFTLCRSIAMTRAPSTSSPMVTVRPLISALGFLRRKKIP